MKRIKEIQIGNPRPDEYGRVGELIYLVDPYFYPALFGSAMVAEKAMPTLMGIENSPFAPGFVSVARVEGFVAGVLVLYTKPFANLPNLAEFYDSNLPLPESSRDVCKRYLLPMCSHVTPDEAYIRAL